MTSATQSTAPAEGDWRALFEAAGAGIVVTDHAGQFLDANRAACHIYGRSREDLVGRRGEEVVGPTDDLPSFRRRLLSDGQLAGELTILRPDGERRLIEFNATVDFIEGQNVSLIRDVTEARADERRLRLLAALVESSDDAIIASSPAGIICSWNRAAEELYGYPAAEVLGKSFMILVPPEKQDETLGVRDRLTQGKPVKQLETRRLRKDGQTIQVSNTVSPIVDKEGKIIAVSTIARDISARQNLEEQLRQSQKMQALGRLSGGVAHDFNNILSVIMGNVDLARRELGKPDSLAKRLAQIWRAAESAARLTRQLLTFSRKEVVQARVLNLNSMVVDAELMLRRVLGEDIQLVTVLDNGLGQTVMDPGHVDQILMNLVVNARDAMPTGGKLTIETSNGTLDERYASTHADVVAGAYVVLSVSDTGIGMDLETQARIFEPFFTTKEQSRGTGLGLATVHGTVKQSGGHISVYSEAGHGTTFRIYLPRTEEPVEVFADAPREVPRSSASETVLLLEDDEGLRELAAEMLAELGYSVIAARSGLEAIEVARRQRVDLLLSDVIMPGMSGRQAWEAIRAIRPQLKVLFVSGYTDHAIGNHGLAGYEAVFLQKPFSVQELARKLREVLDEEEAR